MLRFKITESELKDLFEKSKLVSNDFIDISNMLRKIPKSLLIIRLSSGVGQSKLSKATGIKEGNISFVENGRVGLGNLNISRIKTFVEDSNLDFNWERIKQSFETLDSTVGRFDRLSLAEVRKQSIKGLKARKQNGSEVLINDILKELNIQFEPQASLSVLENTSRLNIIDFAIPNGVSPKILIEVTSGKIERNLEGQFLNSIGNKKLIEGLRIKKFLPQVKLFLFTTGIIDDLSKSMLLECFDDILLRDDIINFKEKLRVLNA